MALPARLLVAFAAAGVLAGRAMLGRLCAARSPAWLRSPRGAPAVSDADGAAIFDADFGPKMLFTKHLKSHRPPEVPDVNTKAAMNAIGASNIPPMTLTMLPSSPPIGFAAIAAAATGVEASDFTTATEASTAANSTCTTA